MQKVIVLCLVAAVLAMTAEAQYWGGYGYGGYYPSYYNSYAYTYPYANAYYGGSYAYPGYGGYGYGWGKKKREAGDAPQEASIEMNPRFQPFAQKAEQA